MRVKIIRTTLIISGIVLILWGIRIIADTMESRFDGAITLVIIGTLLIVYLSIH